MFPLFYIKALRLKQWQIPLPYPLICTLYFLSYYLRRICMSPNMVFNLHASRSHPMISMHNAIVNGGSFTSVNTGEGRKSFEILKQAVAHTAFHDSGARFDPPKCHPNTRVAVLKKIMNWVQRCDSQTRKKFIMWLTGAAGAGKSAIAQSLIELCLRHNLVMASFFFARSDGTRNHAESLIATLVYQIYHSTPAVKHEIISVIDADPLIFTRSLEHQFIELIAKPLHEIFRSNTSSGVQSYRVVVIDGLDECLDRGSQQHILRIICNSTRKFNLPILFFIASRPEHDINVTFAAQQMNGLYSRLYLDDVYKPDDDIHLFFRDSFTQIRTSHPFRSGIPASWPTSEAVESLVRKSSGQFVYASTVVRFIQSIRHQPHHRLDIVMSLRPPQDDLPFSQLDALYRVILSSVRDIDRVLYALSIYSHNLFNRANHDICQFMSLNEAELEILFCDLGALIAIEGIHHPTNGRVKQRMLRFLHASLHDFFLDPMRSREYFLNIDIYRPGHLANIIRYVTLDHYTTKDDVVSSITSFFSENFPLSQSSDKLIQQALLFPLVDILGTSMRKKDFVMSNFILFTLFPFFRRMTRLDQRWALVEKQQQEALDQILLSQMSSYYSHDNLTAYLCLVYHAGTDPLVPCFWEEHSIDIAIPNAKNDTLLLHCISLCDIGTDTDHYRECIVRFLQDPCRAGNRTIGVDAYTRAAVYFIQQLQAKYWTGFDLDDEKFLTDMLLYKNGIWSLSGTKISDYFHSMLTIYLPSTIEFFIYLGYILFFLPRAGFSATLTAQCNHYIYNSSKATRLSRRVTLVRHAMEDYLDRCGSAP